MQARNLGSRFLYCTARSLRFEALESRQLLAVFDVTNLASGGPGSFVDAIIEANNAEGLDTIRFGRDLAGEIVLEGTQDITDAVEVIGPGSGRVSVDARGQSSLFHIGSGLEVAISGLALVNGWNWQPGGGIFVGSESTLTMEDVVVSNCEAYGKGGAIFGDDGSTVTLRSTVIQGNSIAFADGVAEGGGIAAPTVHLVDSRVHDNHVTGYGSAKGGGISATTVTLLRSTISNNNVVTESVKDAVIYATGGGVCAEKITATDSQMIGNEVAIEIRPLQIPRDLIGGGGGLYANEIRLERSTVAENWTNGLGLPGGGAAANSMAVVQSTVERNSTHGASSPGGGLWAANTLTVDRSTVSGNFTNGDRSEGGGLANATQILSSTVSGNSVGGLQGRGGGVYQASRPLLIAFSTITDNQAPGWFAEGGGVWAYSGVTLVSSIVAGNSAGAGKVDLRATPGAVAATNSIVGDAWGTSLVAAQARDNAGNLIGLATSRGGVGVVDAGLTPLAYRGGPTQSHGLRPNSPALDAGGPRGTGIAVPSTDQRGLSRGVAAASGAAGLMDIGAFEFSIIDAGPFADANADARVTTGDLSLLRTTFGQRGALPADVDRDGDVDGADFLLLQRTTGLARPGTPGALAAHQALAKSLWLSLPTAAPGVTEYRLEMATAPGAWTEIRRIPASSTSAWIDNLEAAKTHEFRLRAANQLGVSDPSPAYQAVTPNTAPDANSRQETLRPNRSTTLTLPATDPDGHSLTATAIPPTHGTLAPGPSPLSFVYTPQPNYIGYDQVRYTVDDGRGGQSTGVITLRVSGMAETNFLSRQYVALQASNGQYIAAEGGGGGAVNASRSVIGLWEQFNNERNSYRVSLRTATGSYLQLASGSETVIAAARGFFSPAFEVFGVDDGSQIALLASNGKFVHAVNGGGGALQASASSVGAWETFRFDASVPPPANVRVVGLESTFADLQFDNAVLGYATFTAELQAAGSATWTPISLPTPTSTNFRVSGLAQRTSYSVRVVATRNGTSSTPTLVTFTTLQSAVAAAPQLQSPANNSTTSSRFPTFQWTNVADADSYIFHLYEGDPSAEVIHRKATPSFTTHTIEGDPLRADRDYWWAVEGVNSRGAGPLSAKFKFRTPETVDVAPTPVRPTPGDTGVSHTPLFVWQNVGPATRYTLRIYEGSPDGSPVRVYQNIAEVSGGETSFRVPEADALNYLGNYWWEVRGANDEGPGPFSNKLAWYFETWDAEIVNSPSLRTPNDNATNVSRTATLRWDNLGRATSYHWYLWRDNPDNLVRDGVVAEDPDGVSQWSLANDPQGPLAAQRTYYWAVRGINSRGPGPLSEKRKFVTGNSTSISASVVAELAGVLELSLSDVAGATSDGVAAADEPAPAATLAKSMPTAGQSRLAAVDANERRHMAPVASSGRITPDELPWETAVDIYWEELATQAEPRRARAIKLARWH